jgi:hypothetical protein
VTRLDTLSRDEKDEAKRRLRLPATSPRHMPPERFGELSPGEIAAALEALDRLVSSCPLERALEYPPQVA